MSSIQTDKYQSLDALNSTVSKMANAGALLSPTVSHVPSVNGKVDIDSSGDRSNILVQDGKADVLSEDKSVKSPINSSVKKLDEGGFTESMADSKSFVHVKS